MTMRMILVLAAALASWIWPVAQAPASQTAAPQVIKVSAKKYEFNPAEIRVAKGARVELVVHSEDEAHGIKLNVYPEGAKEKGAPGLALERPAENGKVGKNVDQIIDFVAEQPGAYDFKCAKLCGMGHNRMKGELIVEP